jgi:hypothetical protein
LGDASEDCLGVLAPLGPTEIDLIRHNGNFLSQELSLFLKYLSLLASKNFLFLEKMISA